MELEPHDGEEDRTSTPPFLLKLFYRTGAFHRQVIAYATRPQRCILPSHMAC
jgi:hypothetical protein